MDDPEAELLLAIQDRIQEKVPEIKYTDQNLGQYQNEKFRESMLFPCLLIDFPSTSFSALQGNNQLGDASIVVTLFVDIWNNTNSLTPIEIKKAGLNYLAINQKIFQALQGWSPDFCTPFVRVQKKSHNDNEIGLNVKETAFSSSYEDYSCENETRVKLNLSAE
ncbi:hypothetical protein [Flavobacterium gilvum]|uniref:Uncharacterized protein n=1 Tax=Flavobacterium gilvum TaxID=1492737 RepID=A0AAC9I2L2_9FLAO|nr:hypothetical protein [Flavobacterium gilvum]AOW09504.1 hypothetical protein EM308_08330 [Flavobacterium gilvum]KFC60009.1 hypothetical protein FEM08_11880 [Flavobacterium gilvum]